MSRQKKRPVPSGLLAEELKEQGIEQKLTRYGSAKRQTTAVSQHILEHVPELRKYNKALFDCGSWLVFRNYYELGVNRLIKANLCKKHLLCGLCAMRRSALQVRSFEQKLSQVLSDNPDLVPVLITYTVKNGPDLEERFTHIADARRKMTKRRSNAIHGRKTDTVLKNIIGGAGSFEIKRGKESEEWHPHIHEIALVEKGQFKFTLVKRKGKEVLVPLKFENELRTEWKNQTGDSHMVDVRQILMENDADRFGAMCEAFKYALKLNDMEIEDQVLAAQVLQGRRLQFAYGALHGVKIDENLVDSIDKELELQPYVDLVYKYNNDSYHLEEETDYGDLKPSKKKETKKKKTESVNSKYKEDVQNYINGMSEERKKKISDEIENRLLNLDLKREAEIKNLHYGGNEENTEELLF